MNIRGGLGGIIRLIACLVRRTRRAPPLMVTLKELVVVHRRRRRTRASIRGPERAAVVLATGLLAYGSAAWATPIPVVDCLPPPPTRAESPSGLWGDIAYEFRRANPDVASVPTPAGRWNNLPCSSSDAVGREAAVRGRSALRAHAAATDAILTPGAIRRVATRAEIDVTADDDAQENAAAIPPGGGGSQDSLAATNGSQPDMRAVGEPTGFGGSRVDAIYSGSVGAGGAAFAPANASTATRRAIDRSPQPRGLELWATADVAGSVTGLHPWMELSRVPYEDSSTPRLPLEGPVSADRGSSTSPAAATVPEPGTLALFALGLLLLVGRHGSHRRGS